MAILIRAVRVDRKMQGYQVAAYMDQATSRAQIIIAALAEGDNWMMCADGILLSQHKVTVRTNISWAIL